MKPQDEAARIAIAQATFRKGLKRNDIPCRRGKNLL